MMNSASPLYSAREAERIVLDALRRMHIALQIPMPIERIVQSCDATIIPVYRLLQRGLEGGIGPNPNPRIAKRFAVIIDESLVCGPMGPYNVVLAEETAHLIFDRPEIVSTKSSIEQHELHSHPDWLRRELNRDMIGRVILMPSSLLQDAIRLGYKSVIEAEGFHSGTFFSVVSNLARQFRVTVEAVEKRLEECDLDLHRRLHRSIGCTSIFFMDAYDDEHLTTVAPKKPAKARKTKEPSKQELFDHFQRNAGARSLWDTDDRRSN